MMKNTKKILAMHKYRLLQVTYIYSTKSWVRGIHDKFQTSTNIKWNWHETRKNLPVGGKSPTPHWKRSGVGGGGLVHSLGTNLNMSGDNPNLRKFEHVYRVGSLVPVHHGTGPSSSRDMWTDWQTRLKTIRILYNNDWLTIYYDYWHNSTLCFFKHIALIFGEF